jgi:outer membrane scaffolding protein for murein synthesis (MipA/OmpV family)
VEPGSRAGHTGSVIAYDAQFQADLRAFSMMLRTTMLRALGCVLSLAGVGVCNMAAAEEKPLYEFGLGAGAIGVPDYLGSDEYKVYPGPVPYLVYRGNFFKADREGLRAVFGDSVELRVSFGGTLPVDSDDNDARRGLDDLDPTVEVGPSLDVALWRSPSKNLKLEVQLPVRFPFALDSSVESLGAVFAPRLRFAVRDLPQLRGWTGSLSAGVDYSENKYHDYFYSVAPQFATATRPAFEARGGYTSANVSFSAAKRYPRYWFGVFGQYATLAGSTIERSPLVRQQNYVTVGFGIAYIFAKSKVMVEAKD